MSEIVGLQALRIVVFGALGIVAVAEWRRRGGAAQGWPGATSATVVAAGRLLPRGSSGGKVLLMVADDGAGVPPALVPSLFEPTRGRAASGTVGLGLGLAVCPRLVEAFHGEIDYEDNLPHGARFVVSLRRAA